MVAGHCSSVQPTVVRWQELLEFSADCFHAYWCDRGRFFASLSRWTSRTWWTWWTRRTCYSRYSCYSRFKGMAVLGHLGLELSHLGLQVYHLIEDGIVVVLGCSLWNIDLVLEETNSDRGITQRLRVGDLANDHGSTCRNHQGPDQHGNLPGGHRNLDPLFDLAPTIQHDLFGIFLGIVFGFINHQKVQFNPTLYLVLVSSAPLALMPIMTGLFWISMLLQ